MSEDLSEHHDQLRSVARELLADASGRARGAVVDWALLAETGWIGLEVPEAYGGSGASFAEQAVILHEMGRTAMAGPYLGSAVLGVGLLELLEPSTGRDELLRELCAGERRVAVVMATGEDALCEDAAAFQIVAGPEGALLAGRAPFVPDAAGSDLLVVARDTDATCVVVHVPQGSSAVRVSDQPVVDATRQLSSVSAEGAAIDEASLWRFGSDPERSVSHLMDRGALGVACDSLGLAEAMMEATVAYTSERRQFDRPIGSFQAVKHACADMLVKVLMGRELVALGVESLVDRSAECSTAVSMAKAYTCSTAVEVVGKALQLHGGMGYTWESGIHVALKRAVLNRSLFGAPAAHRRRLAGRYATTPKAVGHI